MVSELAKRVAGTFIADGPPPSIPLSAWFQESLRNGELRPLLQQFCDGCQEKPDPGLARVEFVDAHFVRGFIPCRVSDRESVSTYLYELRFQLDLRRGVLDEVLV